MLAVDARSEDVMPRSRPAQIPESGLQSRALGEATPLAEVRAGRRVMARGERGPAVAAVQRAMARLGMLGGVDGAFGRATERALQRLQRLHELTASGRLDAATLALIDGAVAALEAAPRRLPVGSPRALLTALGHLHVARRGAAAYREAMTIWPDDQPIWPLLTTRSAREEMVRWLVGADDTEAREYASFSNLCTGFAAQLYLRLSGRARVDAAASANLRGLAKIDPTPAPPKLRVPLFIAINRGHAFNAFLVDEAAPHTIGSYLLFEPQNDGFVAPRSAAWSHYVERFGVSLVDLTGFDSGGVYDLRPVREFALSGSGSIVQASRREVVNLLRDLAIVEAGAADYEFYVNRPERPGFAAFIRHQAAKVWGLDDDGLVEAGRLAIGRAFRARPDAEPEVMSARRFADLVGRPDLLPILQMA